MCRNCPLLLPDSVAKWLHQVLVGIAKQIVTLGAIGTEVETLEDSDQLGEPILHLPAGTKFALIVEVGLVDDPLEIVGLGEFHR